MLGEFLAVVKGRRAAQWLGQLAYVVGAVGCGVLALSVVHCTKSISLLTGSDYLASSSFAAKKPLVDCHVAIWTADRVVGASSMPGF